MEKYKIAEQSIIKRYRHKIWCKFIKGLKEYQMIEEGDKIAVCMSGGKDSMILAKCMQELALHGDKKIELVFLAMDPGYNEENRKRLIDNAKELNIPLTIFNSPIFDSVNKVEDNPCYLCARMRRGYLYKNAKALGCNKIALGHHFDDVIETVLLNVLYGGQFKAMMPKLHSENYEGMELIRPLYFVREQDIIKWSNYNEFTFLRCACRFTENAEDDEHFSKRKEIKALIKSLKDIYPIIEKNIFKSTENVNIDQVIAYSQKRKKHHFLDEYEED